MPSATTPPTASTHPDIPPFPPPSTFSILPEIYLLIARIDLLQQNQSQPDTSSIQPTTPGGTALPAITTKDLPTLTQQIKGKIAKARAAIQALPDIERGLAEQENEMRILEARVKALKGRLGELGRVAGQGRSATADQKDIVMGGVEG